MIHTTVAAIVSVRRATLLLALIALTVGMAVRGHAQLGNQAGMLEANTATEAQLAALPHLNADLAKAVLAGRPFLRVVDLNALLSKSLKPEQLAELYAKIFVHINLNSASDAEMQLIPGMGARMVREFKEYRPYKTLDQFRKEMGKYVNATEVARLERYVFIPLNLNTAADADLNTIPGLGARMLKEFKEYRPYKTIEQFRKEMGKYVNAKEVARLERYITIN